MDISGTEAPADLASRNDATRRRNLALLLSTVHRFGSKSRAELTRFSGLNRSTVGALVAELADLGLVVEEEPAHEGKAGRPSPVVAPSRDLVALAINPDSLTLHLALVSFGGLVRVRESHRVTGSLTPERVISVARGFLVRAADELPRGTQLAGAGLAVPGLVNEHDQVVERSRNLGWGRTPIAAMVSESLGVPAALANDANVGVLAETMFGAGRGSDHVIYLNGSLTGLGGGVISEGRMVRGARSFGAELGHTLVDPDGVACGCGRSGCLESEVNLANVWRTGALAPCGLDELDLAYATNEDPALHAELDRQADVLARGIGSMVSVFAPERVILGGYVGALLDARRERIHAAVARFSIPTLAENLTVTRNELRERMMPIGAAEFAFGPILADPTSVRPLSLRDAAAFGQQA